MVSSILYSSVLLSPLDCKEIQPVHSEGDQPWDFLGRNDAKAFDCVDHNKLWNTLKEMGILDYLIYLLRNLYAGQEATVRTGHGTISSVQSLSHV